MSKSLFQADIGQPVVIAVIDLSRKEMLRLESMGLIPGSEVCVMTKAAGVLVVMVGESRVMLEQYFSKKIQVF